MPESIEPSPSDPRGERLAAWALGGPATAAVVALCVGQLATWVPHYLTWPWWADHDVFSVMAQGWDAGLRPYRDLRSNNFPGTIYLFWALGRLFGWGRTTAFYALDAALVILLGAALLAWGRRCFGRALPGAVGFASVLGYYLGQDYTQAAQRDWQGPLFVVLGLLACQAGPGRAGRLLAATGAAAGFVIRPQTVLLWPAMILAVAWGPGEDRDGRKSRVRAVAEWAIATAAFTLLAFVPLTVAGVLGDFVAGLRLAAFEGSYNRISPRSIAEGLVRQVGLKELSVLAAFGLLGRRARPSTRRVVAAWAVALVVVHLYYPLSPFPHAYLNHPRNLVAAVGIGLVAELVLEASGAASLKLAAVLLALGMGAVFKPPFSNPVMSWRAVGWLRRGEIPPEVPMGYRHHPAVVLSAFYPWEDYRGTLLYLGALPRPTRVANALLAFPALAGPTGHLPAFPAESIGWLQMIRRRDEAVFARALEATPDSIVVWSPAEKGWHRETNSTFDLPDLEPVIRRLYAPAARFGSIEVWRRKEAP